MNQISRISPFTDEQAARLARPGTLDDLAAQITATESRPAARAPAAGPRSPARRRWLIGVPLAGALAAAALVATSLGHPGQRVGPVSVGPPAAQALSFTKHPGYITVIVRDPLADPARYRHELARHHLKVALRLLPVSPSLTGTVIEDEGAGITTITAHGRCSASLDAESCPVGIRIPDNFRGQGAVTFGRAARPGEQYESMAVSALVPGEAMHGMTIKGQTVAQVIVALSKRHLTALFQAQPLAPTKAEPPGGSLVLSALPWAPGQVLLEFAPSSSSSAGPSPAASR
jgi:hypothetical protein